MSDVALLDTNSTADDARKAFYAALAKAQGKIEGALKDKSNPHFRSKYADLGAVWDACRQALSENGIGVLQFPDVVEGERGLRVVVETTLTHESGYERSFRLPMPVSKPDAQGIGSAITYARRYALMAAVGIAPEDDDVNAAADKKPANSGNGASKNAAARKLYTELQQDIDSADSMESLQTFRAHRLNEIQALPEDWREELKGRYISRLNEFEATIQEEQEYADAS